MPFSLAEMRNITNAVIEYHYKQDRFERRRWLSSTAGRIIMRRRSVRGEKQHNEDVRLRDKFLLAMDKEMRVRWMNRDEAERIVRRKISVRESV